MKGAVFLRDTMDTLLKYLDELNEIQKQDIQISCLRNGLENVRSAISSNQRSILEKEAELREETSKRGSFILSKKAELNTVREKILKNSELLGQHESQLRTAKRGPVINLLKRAISKLIDEQERFKEESDLLTEEIAKGEQESQALIASQIEILNQSRDIVKQKIDSLELKEIELSLNLDAHEEIRGKQIALLPQEVVDEYEAMRLSAGGMAIAEGSGGACSACHIQISFQILTKLETRRSLNLCENCGRILWIPKKQ